MKELWEQAILPYNLPFTILLGVMVGYWLLTLIGAVGMDSLDMDIDADASVDGDFGDISAAMLRLVNAGMIPVTVVLSILILLMWVGVLTLNFYLNPGHSGLLALGFVVAAFIAGVIGTKIITQPLVPFMRRLKEAENAAPVIGEMGIVRSIELDSIYGQVEVQRPDGAPAILNAKLGPGSIAVPRGTEVAIVSMDEKTGVYLARALPSSSSLEPTIHPHT